MAFCILIFKKEENENFARYSFTASEFMDTEKEHGIFEINKENGEITLIKSADYDEKKYFYQRASYKIFKHWKDGVLPDETMWAS
ncbi:hypothetical protein [Xenorhabdus hominickii]|uniref:Uncharacterized protein n=1 Tax=Xenorhabdus hominickii TaxID=351679 RepID=A0A1V0M4U4_XENHO|nr:hypothetical protein [Xenorhabdus hominickii]ARD69840.1 hypothetical protein [Xenorhabdus hominickii]PHM51884.1 hypothetical protein Xhom_04723 [Xenorhabdus hominickii]